MEPINKFFTFITKNPVVTLKYVLVIAGSFFTFSNFFDCITQNAPISEYLFYVATLGGMTIGLLFIPHNAFLCFILALSGVFCIVDNADPNSLSYGVVFLLFSARVADNPIYTVIMLFGTALSIVGQNTLLGMTPVDAVNNIFAAYVIYTVHYLLYSKRS